MAPCRATGKRYHNMNNEDICRDCYESWLTLWITSETGQKISRDTQTKSEVVRYTLKRRGEV